MGLGVKGDGTRSVIPCVFLAKNMQFRGKRYALHGICSRSARHSLLLSKVQKIGLSLSPDRPKPFLFLTNLLSTIHYFRLQN